MLHLIPQPLHRAALIAAHRLRLVWWKVRKPRLSGCRVLALDAEGRVLLVRHSYGSGRWMLPGGGLARGEDPIEAALRELREEVGCGLDRPSLLHDVDEPLAGAINRVFIVSGAVVGTPRPDGREIIEAAFHDPAALPPNMAVALERGLPEWVKAAKAADRRPPEPD